MKPKTIEDDEQEWDRASTLQQEIRDAESERLSELKARLVARGYNIEQLELDNPYNTWVEP
jgi:uncharacterized protein YhaN